LTISSFYRDELDCNLFCLIKNDERRQKKRNVYDKIIEKIKQLCKLNERAYVINQLIEML
jgi:hypothetical protein